jgi:hypothetical protein
LKLRGGPALAYERKRRSGGAGALTLFAGLPHFSTHKPFVPPRLHANWPPHSSLEWPLP